jgi:hypothetical protein
VEAAPREGIAGHGADDAHDENEAIETIVVFSKYVA